MQGLLNILLVLASSFGHSKQVIFLICLICMLCTSWFFFSWKNFIEEVSSLSRDVIVKTLDYCLVMSILMKKEPEIEKMNNWVVLSIICFLKQDSTTDFATLFTFSFHFYGRFSHCQLTLVKVNGFLKWTKSKANMFPSNLPRK